MCPAANAKHGEFETNIAALSPTVRPRILLVLENRDWDTKKTKAAIATPHRPERRRAIRKGEWKRRNKGA
jgi:hypothetical protein